MNNPMSRKLFQSREAREKLRGMGGIMASSPELAQTVAKFADGMLVEGPNTALLRQIRGIQNTTSEMQARNCNHAGEASPHGGCTTGCCS
jgi:hypothetical protein